MKKAAINFLIIFFFIASSKGQEFKYRGPIKTTEENELRFKVKLDELQTNISVKKNVTELTGKYVDLLTAIPLGGVLATAYKKEILEFTTELRVFRKLSDAPGQSINDLYALLDDFDAYISSSKRDGFDHAEFSQFLMIYTNLFNRLDALSVNPKIDEKDRSRISHLKQLITSGIFGNLDEYYKAIQENNQAKFEELQELFVRKLDEFQTNQQSASTTTQIAFNVFQFIKLNNKSKNYEKKIKDIKDYDTFARGVASLIALRDSKFASDFYSVAHASVEISIALESLEAIKTGIISSSSLAPYGAILFTSISLINHFSHKINTEQQNYNAIMQQLRNISDQINNLYEFNQNRFNGIDVRLYLIHQSILENFKRIEKNLAQVEDLVRASIAIMNDFKSLYKLDQLRNLTIWQQSNWNDNFFVNNTTYFDGLNSKDLDQKSFFDALNTYYNWSTIHSKSPEMSGNFGQFEGNVISYLNSNLRRQFDYEINYYAIFLNNWFDKLIVRKSIANPDAWNRGFQRYLLLLNTSNKYYRWGKKHNYQKEDFKGEFRRNLQFSDSIQSHKSIIIGLLDNYIENILDIRTILHSKYLDYLIMEEFQPYVEKLKKLKGELEIEIEDTKISYNEKFKYGKPLVVASKADLVLVKKEIEKFQKISLDSFHINIPRKNLILVDPCSQATSYFRQTLLLTVDFLKKIINDTIFVDFANDFNLLNVCYSIKHTTQNRLYRILPTCAHPSLFEKNYRNIRKNPSNILANNLKENGFRVWWTKSEWCHCEIKHPHHFINKVNLEISIGEGTPIYGKQFDCNIDTQNCLIPSLDSGPNFPNTTFLRAQWQNNYFTLDTYKKGLRPNPTRNKFHDTSNFTDLTYDFNIIQQLIKTPNKFANNENRFRQDFIELNLNEEKKKSNKLKNLFHNALDIGTSIELQRISEKLNVNSRLISGFIYFGFPSEYISNHLIKEIVNPYTGVKEGKSIINGIWNLCKLNNGYLLIDSYFIKEISRIESYKKIINNL